MRLGSHLVVLTTGILFTIATTSIAPDFAETWYEYRDRIQANKLKKSKVKQSTGKTFST